MKYKLNNWDDLGKYLSKHALPASILNNIPRVLTETDVDIGTLLSKGQLFSKIWLQNEFPVDHIFPNSKVYICAGWYGLGAAVLTPKLKGNFHITCFDQDPTCEKGATLINADLFNDGKFTTGTADIHDVDYTDVNVVVNTSCEHIENIEEWFDLIPKNCLVVLQSNNNFELDGHVNAVNSVDELLESCPLKSIIYSGTAELPLYNRFMVIGIK